MIFPDQISHLKYKHDKLQEGLPPTKMAIREGIIVDVGEGEYDSYPRYGFQFFCWRSPECVREMDLFIEYAKSKKVFYDIGAFHGIFSLVFMAINPDGIVLAFEPMPDAFGVLKKAAAGSNIHCFNSALSGYEGEIEVEEYGGHYRVCTNCTNGIKIKCFQGDNLLDRYPFPDILKVDVEGFEISVLMGALKILSNRPTMFLEVHCSVLSRTESRYLVDFLYLLGYDVQEGSISSLIKLNDINEGEIRLVLQ